MTARKSCPGDPFWEGEKGITMKTEYIQPKTRGSIRYIGRWGVTDQAAITTTPGAYFEVAFSGNSIVLHFETQWLLTPYPHLWISMDDGARVEVPVTRYIRLEAPSEGNHVVRIIYKSALESAPRWYRPLIGRIEFLGYTTETEGMLPENTRPRIEFVGDSITEGVLIDEGSVLESDVFARPYQDDVCATYAWLTAEALNLEPLFMGYGAVGVTKGGCGAVPRAAVAYPYCYDGVPVPYDEPEYILINHGANDRLKPEAEYTMYYMELLRVIAQKNSHAHLIVLSPFCGVFADALKRVVRDFSAVYDNPIDFINASGWIPAAPLHPARDGHKIIAERLTRELLALGIGQAPICAKGANYAQSV